MIIPSDPSRQAERVRWIIDTCLESRKDRKDLYERRRQFFLFGGASPEEVIYNRIESHIDLVASFLYSADGAAFSLSAKPNATDDEVKQYMAAEGEFNVDFRDGGMFDAFGDAIPSSLVYDSMFLKVGWSDIRGEQTCIPVLPWKIGVFSEEVTDFDAQQAFVHSYHIDYDNACQRLIRAGLIERIKDLVVVNTPFESPFPELITRMIISATGGENLAGNVSGSVNPAYIARPSYRPKVDRPMVEFHELYVWDDECSDYRTFWVVDPDIIIADSKATIEILKKTGDFQAQRKQQEAFYSTECNLFLPREHPFVHVCPYAVDEYFWGKAHVESLIPLQEWSNERLDQIHDLLTKQAYPARVGSGFQGLTDEKMDAFGGADTWVIDQLPTAAIKELHPEMPPDIFADYQSIGALFIEASGLTEVLQGKGEQGVRSRGHAKELRTTGAGRIKKAAIRLESPLVRLGDLTLKLNMRNNDDPIAPDPKEDGKAGDPFYYHNLIGDYTLRVAGHSHSPLFTDDTKDMAAILFKAQAIDGEMLVRLLNPPNRDNIIHALRARQKRAAMAAAIRARTPGAGPAPNGKARSQKHGEAQA